MVAESCRRYATVLLQNCTRSSDIAQAFECVPADYQAAFVRELEPNLLKCVKDANGNHVRGPSLSPMTNLNIFFAQVVQKIIERVSPDRLPFPSAFRGSVYELATHPYGCRVLQRCLEHLPTEFTKPLFDELHNYTLALMQDQFGVGRCGLSLFFLLIASSRIMLFNSS